jgi:RimJ/RimL family protein N-acetyltransferase
VTSARVTWPRAAGALVLRPPTSDDLDEDLGLHRVTAGCFADNVASWRVMEKLGMRREQHGVRDSWHADLGWIDGYTYGILSEEWVSGSAAAP